MPRHYWRSMSRPRYLLLTLASTGSPVLGQSGVTNAEGCRTSRSTWDYHCHGREPKAYPATPPHAVKGALSEVLPLILWQAVIVVVGVAFLAVLSDVGLFRLLLLGVVPTALDE